MTAEPLVRFLEKLRAAWQAGTLVKLTLSQYRGPEDGLRNGYARVVELKEGKRLSVIWRYATRDVTKNLTIDEAAALLHEQLGGTWERAHLFTTTGDWQFQLDRAGLPKLRASRPAFTVTAPPEHDREKQSPLGVGSSGWLKALGVTNAEGEARPGMNDKLRQIQRFVELLGHLMGDTPLQATRSEDAPLRVVDMGAGKGYLTFALAEFFRQRSVKSEIIGVEAREDLVTLTNRVAKEQGFSELRFVPGRIGEWEAPHPPDLLVALHACDTATDDALAQAVRGGAELIVVAPCCHKEIRAQLQPPAVMKEVLRHGILAEREAELVTDGLRALLLEIHGYEARVFEFISPEHTGKNLMLTARRRSRPSDTEPLKAQFHNLMQYYGLREQHLAKLLEVL